MRIAMTKEFAKIADLAKVEIISLERIGCSKDTQGNAYICDLRMKTKGMPFSGGKVNDSTAKVRFVKTSDGWAATK